MIDILKNSKDNKILISKLETMKCVDHIGCVTMVELNKRLITK